MRRPLNEREKDLSLLLLYLSGWEEDSRRNPGEKVFRAWKGFRFDVLDALEEGEMIEQFHNIKSVLLTPKGMERARELRERLL
ncbi:MAG: transposase [Candidatus Aminicenantes bacterium]|nr:transposase [Candidatus Aminicenantes bacterium]